MRVLLVVVAFVATPVLAGVSQQSPTRSRQLSAEKCAKRAEKADAYLDRAQSQADRTTARAQERADEYVARAEGRDLKEVEHAERRAEEITGRAAEHAAKDIDHAERHAAELMKRCDPAQPPPPPGPQDPPPQPPPPPPPPPTGACANSSPGTGTASVRGQVFVDQNPWPLLAGWCVQLLDGSGAVVAAALSSDQALDGDGNNYIIAGLPAGVYKACEVLQTGWTQSFPTLGEPCSDGLGYAITVTDGASASFIWFGNLAQ